VVSELEKKILSFFTVLHCILYCKDNELKLHCCIIFRTILVTIADYMHNEIIELLPDFMEALHDATEEAESSQKVFCRIFFFSL
jgi:hypothetical protein